MKYIPIDSREVAPILDWERLNKLGPLELKVECLRAALHLVLTLRKLPGPLAIATVTMAYAILGAAVAGEEKEQGEALADEWVSTTNIKGETPGQFSFVIAPEETPTN
jgi:hypothetical protein